MKMKLREAYKSEMLRFGHRNKVHLVQVHPRRSMFNYPVFKDGPGVAAKHCADTSDAIGS